MIKMTRVSLEELQESEEIDVEMLKADEGIVAAHYDTEGVDSHVDDNAVVNVSFAEPDLFNALDTNRDGEVTRAEYSTAMKKLEGGSSPSPNPPRSPAGASPSPAKAPSPRGGGGAGGKQPTIPDAWAKDLAKAMDTNKDGKVTTAEYNSAMQKLNGGSSPSSPGSSPTPSSAPSGGGGGSQGKTPTTIPDRWVNAHNYWRCIHNSPPLAWDVDFARGAQKWADRGQMSHAKSYKIPPPEGPCGENLAGGSSVTIEGAVDMWHDENPENGPRCGGHCTAMLWKAGVKLGCGIGKSSMGHLYVCRYGGGNPLPNFGGNYEANVGFPDNSKKDECKKKWPLGAGATPGGSPSGGSGRGRSPSGSGGRRGWR